MKIRRFMVMRHDVPALPNMFSEYHWHGITGTDYVVAMGTFEISHMAKLEAHPHLLLLPSIHDETPLSSHALSRNKKAHFDALKSMGVEDTHKMADLARILAKQIKIFAHET